MLRGIYIAAGGMSSRANAIDVLANNLANVNTNGFKADKIATRSFGGMLLSRIDDRPPGVLGKAQMPPRVGLAELSGGMTESRFTDFAPGSIMFTENPLDLALEGPGFFTVENENGQTLYTRDGAFTISTDKYLVNQSGYHVLDAADQPIRVLSIGEIKVDSDGSISIGGLPAGKLGIAEFSDLNSVTKVGHNLFSAAATGSAPAMETEVIQGAVEKSNVSAIHSLVKLLTKYREFEAAARCIEVIDRTLDRVVNEVGRISR